MSRRIWSQRAAVGMLFLAMVLGLPEVVMAAEEHHPASEVRSQPTGRLATLTELEIDVVGLESITLQVKGVTASGSTATRSEDLPPEEYRVEAMWFDRYTSEDEDFITTVYRLLYYKGQHVYVAGTVWDTVDRDGDPSGTEVELNNVTWGFDLKTQSFWIRPRVDRMMPLPRMFRRRDWAGVRFFIPVPLKRFRPEEARALIEGRGGVVAAPEGPVDVVLLPDVFTFTWSRPRNADAEKWIRKGASVLLERNFPNARGEETAD